MAYNRTTHPAPTTTELALIVTDRVVGEVLVGSGRELIENAVEVGIAVERHRPVRQPLPARKIAIRPGQPKALPKSSGYCQFRG